MNMKNASRKPYIYKVTNLENHQYYIGSQCSGKTIGVNYFTSSTNKNFRDDFKNYREEKYKIEIIKKFEDPEKCVRAENYIIRNYMLKKDGLCLNLSYCCNGKKVFSRLGAHPKAWNKGQSPSEETRKKLSEIHKGQSAWNKGLKGIPSPRRIKISIEGVVFESLTEASKYYNVSVEAISRWVKKNQHNAVCVEKCPKI